MTKKESRVYSGIPIGVINLEEKDITGWQENAREWTPFQRDVISRLRKRHQKTERS